MKYVTLNAVVDIYEVGKDGIPEDILKNVEEFSMEPNSICEYGRHQIIEYSAHIKLFDRTILTNGDYLIKFGDEIFKGTKQLVKSMFVRLE